MKLLISNQTTTLYTRSSINCLLQDGTLGCGAAGPSSPHSLSEWFLLQHGPPGAPGPPAPVPLPPDLPGGRGGAAAAADPRAYSLPAPARHHHRGPRHHGEQVTTPSSGVKLDELLLQ